MSISENIISIKKNIPPTVTLIAVSKTYSTDKIVEAYNTGHRAFGENKVQELADKYEQLPKDIQWHLIGHLQTNKVKYIASFVHLIHSVDSPKLLMEINKQAQKNNRIINCLLQIYIAQEETKFGLSTKEAEILLKAKEVAELQNIKIVGLMGMASNTDNKDQIRSEFKALKNMYTELKKQHQDFEYLSMGMSSDYKIAIEEGSNMIRVGSTIFGNRTY